MKVIASHEGEVPLSDEALKLVLGEPTPDAASCVTCRLIGASAWFITGDDGEVKQDTLTGKQQALDSLREHLRFGEHVEMSWVVRCPRCSTLYVTERSHEGGGTEEGWYRVSFDELLALDVLRWNRKPGAVLRRRPDGWWG